MNRQNVKDAQRARAVIELRTRLRDAHFIFLDWARPHRDQRGTVESRFDRGGKVLEKMKELEAYYNAQKPWLESRSRDVVEVIRRQERDYYINLIGVSAATHLPHVSSDEDEVARRVYE